MATRKVARELEKLKGELVNYKVGTINGLGYFNDAGPREMDEMNHIRIAIFGMTGSGKSALVNTVGKLLLGREHSGTAMEQSAGGEGTVLLEEYFCQFGFMMIDTRGFFEFDFNEETELFRILYGAVQTGEELERDGEGERKAKKAGKAGCRLQKAAISEQVHVVLWVVKGIDIRLKQEEYRSKFRFLREHLGKEAITIVTAITHDDELQKKVDPEAEREAVTRLAREATGSLKMNTFLITNWLSNEEDYEVDKQKKVLNMIRTALECGERSVKMRQSKRELEKRRRAESERARIPVKSPVQNTEEPGILRKL